ncbi:MAG TPA: alpha/beta hydrolase [Acidimicrobiia bacterium]|jgi:pimeloyl-ACP methyl ester carboxylesterase|nr:alpha/beta hydrolase [Acidimicrobiia bacterium]
MRVTTDDGVGLATVVAGDPEAPGLLLLHGIGGAKEDFAHHLEALARRHRVVTFDHRGHGESDKPDDERAYSLDRLASDTSCVADAHELRELRILGHSMGGMVMRRFLLAQPGRARAVVFMDTSAGAPPGSDTELVAAASEVVRTGGLAALKQLSDELDLLGSAAYQRILAERPGFAEYADYKWHAQSPVMWTTLMREIVTQPDQLAKLADLTVPTLGIVGDEDSMFLRPMDDIVATVPGARLVVVPDAGHSPQFENSTAWIAAMLDFLHSL